MPNPIIESPQKIRQECGQIFSGYLFLYGCMILFVARVHDCVCEVINLVELATYLSEIYISMTRLHLQN